MCNLAHMEEEMSLYCRDLEAFKGFLKYANEYVCREPNSFNSA